MRSTFQGLETARRGMYTQQSALQVTGHNVANANTLGFTRQRINFEQTETYPPPAMNKPQIPGQIGTGVEAESVQRIRDSFLDVQYRGENNKLGYWETKAESLMKMEEIMNEPSDSGLAKTMDMFWQSLQDLAVNPKNSGARSVVRQRGIALAETFQYLSNSLSTIRQDIKNEIGVTEKEVNSLLKQIHNVNKQIGDVEPHGMSPNDLYDERDRLIDDLSKLVNIKVTNQPSGGNSSPLAEGKAVISLVDGNNRPIANLVHAKGYNEIKVNIPSTGTDVNVNSISIGSQNYEMEKFDADGKLKGLIESFGYMDKNGDTAGTYPDMLSELDNLAFTFAKEFNKIHSAGMSPNEINNVDKNGDRNPVNKDILFFVNGDTNSLSESDRKGFSQRIGLSSEIKSSLDNIANADGSKPEEATTGDSSVLLQLTEVINKNFDYGQNSQMANFRNYYEVLIGGMAVDAQNAVRLTDNSATLRQAVEERRMSTSAVSLDEEMTNMIQYQHAYNASARMISLQDELLDKIINGMGTGGR
ncbi:flagellar hook-associated protein FlgK [Bacillus sp. SG-1]|uniref:flagellar hook-associated protein FlgK n=1 Tax=Bacillus sp. SG-1 TaxID=161544 RepID=UPI0001544BFF|nr:flagellar hook-associated protein FlgK [Bacillus sp. SG-1]EDL63919.1 flagellar hook-associated protein [Bacillus sp. SG-1]